MPAINSIKRYVPHTYYHIYNRGNNKEPIFWKDSDYKIFRNIFRLIMEEMQPRFLLDCFCLLPNHYHFLLYQKGERDIERLMRRGNIRYVMFVNKRYQRTGRLYQSRYKARLVPEDRIEHVRKYILDNPKNAGYENWEHVGMGYEF